MAAQTTVVWFTVFPTRPAAWPLALNWRNEHVVSSASRRDHGPDRRDQTGEGQHVGDPARRAGTGLGAFLRRAEGSMAARRDRLGPPGAARGHGRFRKL